MNEDLTIDEILQAYADKKAELARVSAEESELREQINALAGDEQKETGTIYLAGEKLKAKITRKVNTKFTDKAVLAELLKEHKDVLMPMFAIQFKESAAKVDKFLVSPPPDQKAIADALNAIYDKTPGKPSVEIVLK